MLFDLGLSDPAIDTFVESDWRMRRDTVGGVKTIRVVAGSESPEGVLDPEQARGYWFDEGGRLVKSYFRGMEIQRQEFQDFGGVQVCHMIRMLSQGKLALIIRVSGISASGPSPEDLFVLPGHAWKRAFTDEVR